MAFRLAIESIVTEKAYEQSFVDSLCYIPEDDQQEEYGTLFLHIHVEDSLPVARTLRRVIFDTCIELFYKDLSLPQPDQFEKALKKVNELLQDLTASEGADWKEKTHVSIGALYDDSFVASSFGQSRIYVVRDTDCLPVTQHTEDEVFFEDIASGQLVEHDQVIISGKPLADPLQHALPGWGLRDIHAVVDRLESELKFYDQTILAFGCLPVADSLEESEVTNSTSPSSITSSDQILGKLTSFWNQAVKKGKVLVKNGVQSGNIIEKEEIVQAESLPSKLVSVEDSEFDDIEQAISGVSMYKNKESKWENTWKLLVQNIQFMFDGIFNKKRLSRRSRHTIASFVRGRNVLLLIVIAIVAMVAISMHTKMKENTRQSELREKLYVINEQVKDIKTKNALDEKDKARELIELVTVQLASFDQAEVEVIEKQEELAGLLDTINEVNRITPSLYGDLKAKYPQVKAHTVVNLEDILYVVSEKAVFEILLEEVVLKPIPDLLEDEIAVKAEVFAEERSLLILTSKNRMFEYKEDEFTLIEIANGEAWPQVRSLEAFGRRIYVIEENTGRLLRYTRRSGSFSAPEPYAPIDPPFAVENVIDIAIDGDIYFLTNDGNIFRTRSQEVLDFGYTEFPEQLDLSGAIEIQKSAVLRQLYLLDPSASRILVTGYKGFYAKQFILENIGEIVDMYVDEESRVLFVLTAEQLYEIVL